MRLCLPAPALLYLGMTAYMLGFAMLGLLEHWRIPFAAAESRAALHYARANWTCLRALCYAPYNTCWFLRTAPLCRARLPTTCLLFCITNFLFCVSTTKILHMHHSGTHLLVRSSTCISDSLRHDTSAACTIGWIHLASHFRISTPFVLRF